MSRFTIDSAPSQEGKIAIVTGANTGLGYEVTVGLVMKGARVIMACRNLDRAEKARQKIVKQIPSADLDILELDLNDIKSVRSFAEQFKTQYKQLDILINNAGIFMPPLGHSIDSYEQQFAVNYLGHFLLTGLLFPLMKSTKGSRIVSVSSKAHEWGTIDFENLNAELNYSKMGAYSQSKLACLVFSYELQRRINKAGYDVISVAAHPGGTNTELGRYTPKWIYNPISPLISLMLPSPTKAARSILMAAIDPDVNGGEYFGPKGFYDIIGPPGIVKSKPHAHDETVARKLWEISEKMVHFTYDF